MPNVLVTGTSKGIGYAATLELARAGHTVYATMRNPGRAPELGEAVAKEKLPVKILVIGCVRLKSFWRNPRAGRTH